MYIYPDNLKAKPVLWLWHLKDIAVITGGGVISAISLVKIGLILPFAITITYAFLTIRFDGTSILDFIRYACSFFIFKQQYYEWGEKDKKE